MKKKKIELTPSAQMDQQFWQKFDQEFKAPPKTGWQSLKWWSFSSVAMVLILSVVTIRHLEKEEKQASLLTQYENDYWETQDLLDQDDYALSSSDIVEENETSPEEDFLL